MKSIASIIIFYFIQFQLVLAKPPFYFEEFLANDEGNKYDDIDNAVFWSKTSLTTTENGKVDWEEWREFPTHYTLPDTQMFMRLSETLLNSFPKNKTFKTADYLISFHEPEVYLNVERLYIAYIKRSKNRLTKDIIVEKIERTIPLNSIIENYSFEWFLGQADWKYHGIWYRYFKVNETALTKILLLDPHDWSNILKVNPSESALEKNQFWFPTDKKSQNVLDSMFHFVLVYATEFRKYQNIERANEILNLLVPDNKISVYSEGIRLDEYTNLWFSDKRFDSIVYITEENEEYYLHFCCVTVEEFEYPNNLEEHTTKFATTAYHFPSTQLPLAEEFKTIIQNMKVGK